MGFVFLVALLLISKSYSPNNHEKLSIVRVYIKDYKDLENSVLKNFSKEDVPEIAAGKPGEWYDLIVNQKNLEKLATLAVKFEVKIDDLENEKAKIKDNYHSYDEIVSILRNYKLLYLNICKVESIGPTYEGRWIYGLKISDNVNDDEDEPEILFSGCHHAREWASVEVPLFIADTLLRGYGVNSTITDIVNNREIWIFPVINVDGYVYDYSGGGRSWRKNREPYRSSIGTDPNRNYNGICDSNAIDGWGVINSSSTTHNPSQATFCGRIQHSAYEINSYATFIKSRNFVAIIDYHSYSELVLAPWGHKWDPTPHDQIYNQIGGEIANRISSLSGGSYTYQKSIVLYPTTGGSSDWEYGWSIFYGGKPCFAITVEIGTTFYQNTSDLPSIKRENFDGALYLTQMADYIQSNMRTPVPSPIILYPVQDTVYDSILLYWTVPNKEFSLPESYDIQVLKGKNKVLENFESNLNLWVTESFGLSTRRAHDGMKSLRSDSVNYAISQARTKYPYYVEPGDSFTFWFYYDTETDWDVGVVEISENLREWIPLESERFTGNSGGWIRKTYDLSPYDGKTLYFRFRYMTDGSVLNEGIYIDEVYPVPSWDSIFTFSSIQDTAFTLTGLEDGEYYIRVRGYNQFGYGNYSQIKKVYLVNSASSLVETNNKIIIPSIVKSTSLIFMKGLNPKLIIYDVSGRVIYEIAENGNIDKSFKLNSLRPGIYFYQFESGRQIQKGRFIKLN